MRREILRYLWPYRIPFTIALCQVFLISAFEILKPWPLKVVIDNVLSGKPLTWTFAASYSTETILFLSASALCYCRWRYPRKLKMESILRRPRQGASVGYRDYRVD